MTRSELIERISQRYQDEEDMNHQDVELAVKGIIERIARALARGQRVEIRGFGSFSLAHREPRVGRNPRTGQSVALGAKYVPRFKAGKALRDAVDDSRKK